jgi:hypothetical protein
MIAEPDTAGTPAIAAEQIRRHTALIEEDVPVDVTQRLPLPATLAGRHDVRPTLFVGV